MYRMRAIHVAIALLCLYSAAQAQGALEGWSYRTDAYYLSDQYADRGGLLSDGQSGSTGRVIYRGNPVVIEIALAEAAAIERVLANVFRHNMNYKLSDLVVQAQVGGHWEQIGSAPGFWGPTETNDFEIDVPVQPTQTTALRLVFNTDGILSVSEIALFGRAAGGQAGPEELPFTGATEPTVRQQDLDGDGAPEVILENSKVGLVFYPAFGGVCKVLYLKDPGVNLVTPGGPDMALFRDQLWDPSFFFSRKFYHFETGSDANAAWVELWTTGEGGILSFTEMRKRITIRRDSEVVTADYRLSNEPSSQTDYVYGQWWHNFLGVRGQANTYYFPTEDGVQELRYDPSAAGEALRGDHWYRNPARGWVAVRADSGAGLAIEMPYDRLNTFYAFIGAGYSVATLEWRFNRLLVKSGESIEAQIRLTPFASLPRVDGAVEGVVGAIEIAEPAGGAFSATASVHVPAGAEPVIAELGWRASEATEADFTGGPPVEVAAGSTATIPATTPALQPGSYVFVCRLARGGTVIGDFERPFTIGGARLVYHRAPLQERVGLADREEVAGLPRHDLSRALVTPHIPWANPLRGGAIKALTLTDDQNVREVIELAQRLELDFTYVKFRTMLETEWLYQGDRSIPTLAHAQRRLLEVLNENEFDLILLSGLKWDHHFTPEIRERIVEQVRGGTGLIFIEPDGFSAGEPLAEGMGIADDRNYYNFHRWQPVAEHYLTGGLPWSILPATRRMDYTTWPAGEVLATIGEGDAERPLMVASQLGEGRVLALTYDVLTHDLSYRGYAGITPSLSYRGKWLRDEFTAMTWDYWEGWYALLTRACTWAAGRETPVRLSAIAAPDVALGEGGAVTISGETAEPGAYQAEVTFRDRWSKPVASVRVPWQDELRVPLPADLRAGLTLVDVIVRDGSGASVGWGEGSFTVTAPARITAVEVEERTLLGTWAEGQEAVNDGRSFVAPGPFTARVGLDTLAPLPDGYRLRARLVDTHGRLLGEEQVALAPAATEATFSISPPALRSMGVEWQVELLRGDTLIDSDRARALCVRPREYDALHFQSWNGMFLWRTEYLWPTVDRLVEDLGLDVSRYGSVEFANGQVWDEYWNNRANWWGGLLGRPARDVPEFRLTNFAQIRAEYDSTGDKALLARNPCLADPDWREAVRQYLLTTTEGMQEFGGAHCYDTGDEMSLTYYTQYFDFCWSEHHLPLFREWLAAKYGDLAGLNAAWGTDFGAWDEVVPLTLAEAREAENPAPWADHRDYMDSSVAEFMSFVRATVQEVDPDARVGMSGTQAPRAGNGMDWWKMSTAFNHYASYNTDWSNEMRRSFQGDTMVGQAPYNAGYWGAGRPLEYRMFWCLLHDTVGISAWTTNLFFYGDLTFSESGADTRDNLRELRGGLWAQVRQAQRQNDGIALHYSHNSIRAATLTDRLDELVAVRDSWVKLLEDLGLQYDFVSTEQIEDGKLVDGGFRLLIVPDSLAVSAAEVERIRAFVNAGGTVLADMGCALRDGSCRPYAAPALDELFGISRGEITGAPPATAFTLSAALGEDAPAGAEVRVTVAEDNLSLAGGTAHATAAGGATPVLITNAVGQGRAIYLNLNLSQFDAERKFGSPTERAVRSALLALLGESGIAPAYTVRFASGNTAHVEQVRYRLGETTILGLLRPAEGGAEDEVATVALGAPMQVYSLRQHKDLGRLTEITVPLAPGQVAIYALSPTALPAVALTGPDGPATPGQVLSYRVAVEGGGPTQAVRVTVQRPDGTEVADYAQTLIVRDGAATGTIPLAFDDPAGTWHITARSALTGASAEAGFEVR